LEKKHLETLTKETVITAKRVNSPYVEPMSLAEHQPNRIKITSPYKKSGDSWSHQDKVALVLDTNKAAAMPDIKNRTTSFGWLTERRMIYSSEGTDVMVENMMTGMRHTSTAAFNGRLESVHDSRSQCAGFEFLSSNDWCQFTSEISKLTRETVRAKTAPAGIYQVVADSDLIGVILHEAFGHAVEGDFTKSKESILTDKVGQQIANLPVSLIDEGVVPGGFFHPYDDEGVATTKKVIIDHGILTGFLHSRETAEKAGRQPTGNARAQDFSHKTLVRQTNLFMLPGTYSLQELIEEIDDGIYLCGKGAKGGEVDVANGTFTFHIGPSYTIRNGKIQDLIRGASVSGTILDTLLQVSAVGEASAVRTSLFGGCGKGGQRVRVGYGGPPVRIQAMTVGGDP
jgi:TldD protein